MTLEANESFFASTDLTAYGIGPETSETGEANPFHLVENGQPAATTAGVWLESAADLLREPDPGPTPFLVSKLIVDQAIATIVGPWKVAKSYSLLELAVAIVTGRDAFDAYGVPLPGPVVLVMEESGRAAFHRRLDRLSRGYALDSDALAELYFVANLGVRLNEPGWQERLLEAGRAIRPRAILLDPLVRLKGATVDESSQREMGPVLDFMRELRDESRAAVIYSHHTGHTGSHQRGSSDLEGYWESKLQIKKDADGIRTITADHREAESGHEFRFRLNFDEATRTLRLTAISDTVEQKVEEYLREHPGASANEIFEELGGNRPRVLQVVANVKERLSEVVPKSGTTLVPPPPGLPRTVVPNRPPLGGVGTSPADLTAEVVPSAGTGRNLVGLSVHCWKHDKATTVTGVSHGLAYLECGCHVGEPA